MKPRTLTSTIQKAMKTFPAVVVTGPRQSGKTTLLRHEFSNTHVYRNLENPDARLRAKNDPIGFLDQLAKKPVILDEIQNVPELLPYIKSRIDDNRIAGQWLITGSQNFTLMQNISESLAGRAAILSLLPFSVAETIDRGKTSLPVADILTDKYSPKKDLLPTAEEMIIQGSYPEVVSNPNVDRSLWYGSYMNTYLERDIRNLTQVGDLGQFEIFLRACAARTGQILDLSSLARDIGISFTTAKRWLSLLETGYQVLLLYPYYKNIGKRLVKRPKIYFTDTGLVSYLMGIDNPANLADMVQFGPLFETMVIIDFWKRFFHHGQSPTMYYLRTRDGLEIDLIIELKNRLHLIEIKSSSTIKPEHAGALVKTKREMGAQVEMTMVISNSNERFSLGSNIYNVPFTFLLPR